MTGRARGRARGRTRGPPPQDTRRPGDGQPRPSSGQAPVGRGGRGGERQPGPPQPGEPQQSGPPGRGSRGRGQPPSAAQQQQPPVDRPEAQLAQQMQGLSVQEGGRKEGAPRPGGGGRGRGEAELATKPVHIQDKRGTSGKEIQVVSNYIVMRNRPNCALYQYNVSYSPQVESKKMRVALLYSYSGIGQTKAFDGMILYLPSKLPDQVTKYTATTKRGENIEITITLTNELSANSPVCLQLFNVIFRKILHNLEMIQIGRHYYYNKRPINVPAHRLELWPGFVTSILQYERNIMLGLDISHKILRTDTVYDFMNEVYTSGKGNFHDEVTKNLVGEIVLTRYNNKTYRIDDIDFRTNPMTKFKGRNDEEMTFVQYYKRHYDIDIMDQKQPLIVSNPKAREVRARGGDASPILLVPELCTRTGLSDDARADFRIMKDLGEHTRVSPEVRQKRCMDFIQDMKRDRKCREELEGWNLEFDDRLVKYSARIVPPEVIFQKTAKLNYKPNEADWSRDMRGNDLITSVSLHNVLMVATRRDGDMARDFMNALGKVGPPMGIRVDHNAFDCVSLENDRTDNFVKAIMNRISNDTQLVIVILPTNRKDRYDSIKKTCCLTKPVPSQCILGKTLKKKPMIMSVTTKVAMQINCKLGGELWAVEIPLKGMMVIGVDTYHDSSRKGRSVMGFIASTNSTLTRYYSQCMFQHTGMELGDNLKACMANALQTYREINHALPERIVIYRDGVGDGQLAVVVDHEVAQIKSGFPQEYRPKFAVVVVKKRINTRIFHEFRGALQNPPPGTVVDTEVTNPQWYDFFIVSQSVRQGTVTPTHFNVICDSSGLKPDHMQRLTYKLCHLYYNWPGTIRVPAPCQYAHKLAFLVGQSIHETPSPYLADRLYYL